MALVYQKNEVMSNKKAAPMGRTIGEKEVDRQALGRRDGTDD